MIDSNSIIIRYGEISLKGKNRIVFEKKLAADIKRHLKSKGIKEAKVILKRGRIYVENLQEDVALDKIFGIYSYSPALKIVKDYRVLEENIKKLIVTVEEAQSFRVSCQRIDKGFFKTSVEIEREMGEVLFMATKTAVKLKSPDLEVQIEIGEDGIYIFFTKVKCAGGLPYGTAGKLISLISAGIDSPVATWMMMKRGVEPVLLHFKIGEEEVQKVIRLKEKLEEYASGNPIELIIISRADLFGGKFSKLYNTDLINPYICILCKYMMHKKANQLCDENGALGIITGDNLAQVASQTLKNIFAYKTGSKYPGYSPLIAYEKEDTIKIARRIGTYDISISSCSDSCIPPKKPKTGVSYNRFQQILDLADI
jgi:thiamine biosynthesis protein ThiI